jgi:hypothetical protein
MDLQKAIERHARFLSDPALDGRAPGTIGHEIAKNYLLEQLKSLELHPLFGTSFSSEVTASGTVLGENLGGYLPGSGTSWILFGAHYDHFSGIPGADDNAAAVAILLGAAARLHGLDHACSIAFCFFDLEEPPYFRTPAMGSIRFAEKPPFPLDVLKCAIIMDLCGHDVPISGAEDGLFVLGAEYSSDLLHHVRRAAPVDGLQIFFGRNERIDDLSDHHIFRIKGCPFLFLSCGWWEHYHQKTDTFEKLNLRKMTSITIFLTRLATVLESGDVRMDRCPDFISWEAKSLSRILGSPVDVSTEDVEAAVKRLHRLLR